MTKTSVEEYREAIVEAVAELDRCDGSRIGQNEAMDSARSILETAYGDNLDEDVQEYIDENDSETDDDSEKD
jgi:hypothetical protein